MYCCSKQKIHTLFYLVLKARFYILLIVGQYDIAAFGKKKQWMLWKLKDTSKSQ